MIQLKHSLIIGIGFIMGATLTIAGCGGSSGDGSSIPTTLNGQTSSDVSSGKLNIHLTDAPIDDVTNVFVYIEKMELLLIKNDKGARVTLAENVGTIDLLKLQNGLTLPLANLAIPSGAKVRQIRLYLKEGYNNLVIGGQTCPLQTPSAMQSGLKLILPEAISIETGYRYDLTIDFDAKKSIVLQGNGGCLLKPVLKLKTATKIIDSPVIDDEVPPTNGDDIIPPVTVPTTTTTTIPMEDIPPVTTTTTIPDITLDLIPVTLSDGRVIYVDPVIFPYLTPEELENYF